MSLDCGFDSQSWSRHMQEAINRRFFHHLLRSSPVSPEAEDSTEETGRGTGCENAAPAQKAWGPDTERGGACEQVPHQQGCTSPLRRIFCSCSLKAVPILLRTTGGSSLGPEDIQGAVCLSAPANVQEREERTDIRGGVCLVSSGHTHTCTHTRTHTHARIHTRTHTHTHVHTRTHTCTRLSAEM